MAKLFWQGESDHIIGDTEAFIELALHPFGGGVATALGTGFFVATVKGVMGVSTVWASVDMPAESGSAAGANAFDGTPLRMGERRVGGQECRQEAAESRNDAGSFGVGVLRPSGVEAGAGLRVVMSLSVGVHCRVLP